LNCGREMNFAPMIELCTRAPGLAGISSDCVLDRVQHNTRWLQ
jgi:hypothetical protein